jgi:hypothetical protein
VSDDTLARIHSVVDAKDRLMRTLADARPGYATYSPEPATVERFEGLDDDEARDQILRQWAGDPFDRPWVGIEPAAPATTYHEVRPPRWYQRLRARRSPK